MKILRRIASVSPLLLLTAMIAFVPSGGAGAASKSVGTTTTGTLTFLGSVDFREIAASSAAGAQQGAIGEFPNHPTEIDKGLLPPTTELPIPTAPNTPIATSNPRLSSWTGLNHRDQRLAANGQQFSLEPPDQGLCVGSVVMESVNDALMIWNKKGQVLLPAPISISQAFGLPNPITRPDPLGPGGPPFGPFVSDPKCYFDADTGHWFSTVLEIDLDPDTGAFGDAGETLIAVTKGKSPLGVWNIYALDATDPDHPNCPCFGDQPLIGADQFGFYVSTAEYSLDPFGAFANFAQLYAIDKAALVAGDSAPSFTHFSDLGVTTSATLQPATSPGGVYETGNGGTEFLVSGYDCGPPACAIVPGQQEQLDVWALTGTSSIPTGGGSLDLEMTTVPTEVYGQPIPMKQKDGPHPLATLLGDSLEKLNANDDRVNQVVFAEGKLWTGVNTAVQTGVQVKTGIAWFVFIPTAGEGSVSA